jgi:thiamine-monophosphate kinase
MSWREFDLIKEFCGIPLADPSVLVGPGDDCAVLDIGGTKIVITTDLIQEGTDFLSAEVLPYRIGWKAIMISASDIAAMGCRPTHFVVASVLPAEATSEFLNGLWSGLYEAAARVGASVVGGDLSKGSLLSLTSTGLGTPYGTNPILRSTARAGDRIFVTGPLGGSILGKHLDFTARTDLASLLASNDLATSMIDVSDGLSGDLPHIARASGLGFLVHADRIPVSDDASRLAARTGKTPIEHALHDGEDFELVFTVVESQAERLAVLSCEAGLECFEIGEMKPAEHGMVLRTPLGDRQWETRSYEH